MAVNIGQAKVAAVVPEGQLLVIHPQEMEDRGVQIVHVDAIFGRPVSDLVGRADRDGSWWVARSDGQRFQNYYWGEIWDTNIDWLASAIADFDGDGTADLLGANTDSWRLSS